MDVHDVARPVLVSGPFVPTLDRPLLPPRVIALACSAGGLAALGEILSGLADGFPTPIIVAQHRSDRWPCLLVDLLALRTSLSVRSAQDRDRLESGTVYVCPPGKHIEVVNQRQLRVTEGPRIQHVRPSADRLFRSVAQVFGVRGVCVVLSGGGHDGALATRAVRSAGGTVIAQDDQTSRFPEMPISAVDLGSVDLVLPVHRIAFALTRLVLHP